MITSPELENVSHIGLGRWVSFGRFLNRLYESRTQNQWKRQSDMTVSIKFPKSPIKPNRRTQNQWEKIKVKDH